MKVAVDPLWGQAAADEMRGVIAPERGLGYVSNSVYVGDRASMFLLADSTSTTRN
jgi:hypothetical protein